MVDANADAVAARQIIAVVAAKIPDFWPEDTQVWFQQVEAQFRLSNITTEQTKFDHVIMKLDRDTVRRVRDLISSTPSATPYTQLKNRLLGCYTRSTYEELLDFQNVGKLGDRRPSELMDELLSAIPSVPPTTEGSAVWIAFGFLNRLPDHLRSLVTALNLKPDMRELAEQADRLWMASGGAAAAVRQSSPFVNALPMSDLAEALPDNEEDAMVAAVRQFRRFGGRQGQKQSDKSAKHSLHVCESHSKHGLRCWTCSGRCSQPGCSARCELPTVSRPAGNGMAGGRRN